MSKERLINAIILSVESTFSEWLQSEIDLRGWSWNKLASEAHLSSGTIYNIRDQVRGVGPDSIKAIADALKLDPEYVMRVAGLLPPERGEPSAPIQEVIQLMERIPARDQQHLLEIVRAYCRRYQPEDRKGKRQSG